MGPGLRVLAGAFGGLCEMSGLSVRVRFECTPESL